MVVIEYRNGDVDTEDGTFATTETDAIIGLEMSLAEAFNDNGDDATFLECWANVEKYCDKLAQLQSRISELEKALNRIAYPIQALQDDAEKEGAKLNGGMAIVISKNAEVLKQWAIDALSINNINKG